jgi:hypothetical protein
VNEQNRSIAELWDGVDLKCTFRRCVDNRLFSMWEEIVAIASSICLTDDEGDGVTVSFFWCILLSFSL